MTRSQLNQVQHGADCGRNPPLLGWADPHEQWVSVVLCVSVLVVLTAAKSVATVPYVGSVALGGAAFWQLRAPLWRLERQGLGTAELGLTWRAWRVDLRVTLVLATVVLPVYAVAYHVWATSPQTFGRLQTLAPHALYQWAPHCPHGFLAWLRAVAWFTERCATHLLGVALPEELFYRGYLQPVWQCWWPPKHTVWTVPIGVAAVAAAAVFSLGHILGEWQLARLGPFFPALLFAWQRNRSGTILGAVGLHGLCNIFAEVWVCQYIRQSP